MRVSEIRVKRIRVNQGLGVLTRGSFLLKKISENDKITISSHLSRGGKLSMDIKGEFLRTK